MVRAHAILDTPPERCFDRIAEIARSTLNAPMAGVGFFDEERIWFKSALGFAGREFARAGTCWDDSQVSEHALIIGDASKEAEPRSAIPVRPPPARSVVAVPLTSRDCVIGTLAAMDVEPRAFSGRRIELLRGLGDQVEELLELRLRNLEAERALRASRMLEEAATGAADAIMVTETEPLDEPGPRILYVNPAFTRITGYASAEAVGRSPRFLQGPDTNRAELNRIRGALLRAEAVDAELLNYRRDGSRFWVQMSIAPVRDESGHLIHFVSVQRDVTGRKERDARCQKAERMRSLQRLAGGVAHNINNQLTVISGYAHLLLEEAGGQPPVAEYISRVLTAGDGIARIAASLLRFSRHNPLAPSPIDINQFIQNLYPALNQRVGSGIRLELSLSPEAGLVQAGFEALNTIVEELLKNAIEAVGERGAVRITTGVKQVEPDGELVKPGRYILLTIADTGGGMDPETVSNLFEPFFSTKGPERGTGLPMVYGLVTKAGGDIMVESLPGIGTIVTVYLPAAEQAAAAPAEKTGPEAPAAVRILLIEDNAAVKAAMTELLRKLGHSVLTFCDAEGALNHLAETTEEFDLLITDLSLPRMDGLQLIVHAGAARAQMRFLCVTGFGGHGWIQAGDRAVPLLPKPFGLEQLKVKIAEAMA